MNLPSYKYCSRKRFFAVAFKSCLAMLKILPLLYKIKRKVLVIICTKHLQYIDKFIQRNISGNREKFNAT